VWEKVHSVFLMPSNGKNATNFFHLIVSNLIVTFKIIGSTNKFPPFFNQKFRIYCERTVHNVLFKVKWPSLATTFSHLFGSIWIPHRKNASSFEAIQSSIQFLVSSYDVMCCSDHASSIRTNGSRKKQYLENTAGGVELPI